MSEQKTVKVVIQTKLFKYIDAASVEATMNEFLRKIRVLNYPIVSTSFMAVVIV